MLNVFDINDYMVSMFVFRNTDIEKPTLFTSFFEKNKLRHSHATRISDDLYVPTAKTNVRKFSIRIKEALTWNSIPDTIRNSKSSNIFKRELKKYLLKKKSK